MMDGVQEHGSQQTNKQMKVVENLPMINKTRGVSSHCGLAILH
jgi:hypothetical protein